MDDGVAGRRPDGEGDDVSSIAIPQRQAFVQAPGYAGGGLGDSTGVRRGPVLRPVDDSTGVDLSTWRRFLVVVAVVVATVLGAVGLFALQVSGPTVAERTDGHVMVEPHRSLWEVAVATAPAGVDPSDQLSAIEAVNAGTIGDSGSWRVVLLPAR